jgi:allantoicase
MTNLPDFASAIDLASARLGGHALWANDEFFAEKENLLKPEAPVFITDRYTDRGKWMDGWETRRRRPVVQGAFDWCVIRLGLPGHLRGFDVDTSFFVGNPPEWVWIDGLVSDHPLAPHDVPNLAAARWEPIVPRTQVGRGQRNFIAVPGGRTAKAYTHVRLSIDPDGGVARFRAYGEPWHDWSRPLPAVPQGGGARIDLGGMQYGARALACNDMFFSSKDNINQPWPSAIMSDGWETRRRRSWNPPGEFDWIVLRLAKPGYVDTARVETFHFKGNFPEACALDATRFDGTDEAAAEALADAGWAWQPLVPWSPLGPHAAHDLDATTLGTPLATHVRLRIRPDGGVSRLRLFGVPG